jgi:transposase-like protein
MPRKTPKKFTNEFKATALELLGTGKPVREVAEDLGISIDLLYACWRCGGSVPASGPKMTF